ncbi:MAG: hypothetical protein KBC43_04825 [Bacteroidales bacterium]|nr:hypothetical protein [Bacteroidales bacterium]
MRAKVTLVAFRIISIAIFVFLTIPGLTGQNSDSLVLKKESRHFNFYSTKGDVKVLDSLAITLENNYSRITNRLGINIDKKANVKVYPNVKSYHAAINQPDAPDWAVGAWNGHALVMVSPLNPGTVHTYESLMQVIVHEFVHMAVYYAVGDSGMAALPQWLSEGYAQYEAGQLNDRVLKYVKSCMMEKAPPTWTELDAASPMEFGNMNGYAYSATIVEFLITTYGIDKLIFLIREPENGETIYDLSNDLLEEQWIQYLNAYQVK